MTVIVWDGTTLAADKRMCGGGAHRTVTKIFRVAGCLVGATGAADRVGAFLQWFADGCLPDAYPPNPSDDSVFLHVVRPSGVVERYEDSPWPIRIEDRHYAAGSGEAFAYAALHLGCTARQAVEVASALEESCGNGVDEMRFEDAP